MDASIYKYMNEDMPCIAFNKSPVWQGVVEHKSSYLRVKQNDEIGSLHLHHSTVLNDMHNQILETQILMSPKSCNLTF